MTGNENVKVTFQLDANDWHGHSTESLWAEKVGRATYRILNVPFFAKEISYFDVVYARKDRRGRLLFEAIVDRGGFSTMHLVAKTKKVLTTAFQQAFGRLESLGIDRERGESGDLV
ncbi:MAG: DUF4265 domain-containing protein, partial [Betaproteobacteria bacterium]